MAEQIERDVLNRLMQTCRDGELGFRYAASRSSHRCQHASRRPAIITTNWNPSRLEFLRKTPVRHEAPRTTQRVY